ncbi:hypothetical protein MMC19_003852 [Ptychographa xylographoides]|nr:hypothetical protein [Ptychographa xylographoides]
MLFSKNPFRKSARSRTSQSTDPTSTSSTEGDGQLGDSTDGTNDPANALSPLSTAPPALVLQGPGRIDTIASRSTWASQNSLTNTGSTPEKLGLQLVFAAAQPVADIILVHGLGGSCVKTWSWNRNPQNFWPPWLQQDTGVLSQVRVLTYGYNANFKGPDTSVDILDFAKGLLNSMSGWFTQGQRSIGSV